MTRFVDSIPTAKVDPFTFAIGGLSWKATCEVSEIDYQRNGVGGEGFFVVKFVSREGRSAVDLVAIVFDTHERGRVAVINSTDLTAHYRGDMFEDGLREAIAARQDQIWPGV